MPETAASHFRKLRSGSATPSVLSNGFRSLLTFFVYKLIWQ